MRPLVLGFCMLLASIVHAVSDAQVIEWTKNTLINTLSIDYNYSAQEETKRSQGFTPNAWRALTSFLGGYVQTIRDNRLALHPHFIAEPKIVDSGITSGIRFWRVNETVLFPELNLQVAFSLLVLATRDSFIIQSMNMRKQEPHENDVAF